MPDLSVQACIVGGGPAGMMAGLLLARAGVSVAVLEKHADFLRDFRGDTIHPSTLEVMEELGLGEAFLEVPHRKAQTLSAVIEGRSFRIADLRHLPVRHRFIASMLDESGRPIEPPLALRMVDRLLQRLPARVIGLGFRPEHVESPVA